MVGRVQYDIRNARTSGHFASVCTIHTGCMRSLTENLLEVRGVSWQI